MKHVWKGQRMGGDPADTGSTEWVEYSEVIVRRFWSRVMKSDECWEWIGATNDAGYGQMNVSGKCLYAHRMSYEIHRGSIVAGLCVLHRCDNPPCVNPAHLSLGTKRDNTQDMLAKGRHGAMVKPECVLRGSRHGLAKLNEQKVVEIRRLGGLVSQRKLAASYGVSQGTIRDVLNRSLWKHVTA